MNILAEDGAAWRKEFAVRARPFRVRWRRQRLVSRALNSLWLPILGSGLLLALLRFTLLDLPGDTGAVALPGLVWLLVMAVSYLVDRPAPARLARAIDEQLGLDERLSTALALSYTPPTNTPAQRLLRRQRVDALDILADQGANGARSFHPVRLHARGPLLAAGLLAVLLLPLGLVPSPVAAARAEHAALRDALTAQAARLAAVRRETVARPELPAASRDLVDAQLAAAENALRTRPPDRAAGVAALSQAADQLRGLLPDNYQQRAAARTAAARDLQSVLSGLADTAPAGNSDLEKAAALVEAAKEQITQAGGASRAAQQALAGSLDRTATGLDATDPRLAAAFRQAATGLRSGKGADQALQTLADVLGQTARDQAATDAVANALAQVDDSRSQVAQAGLPASAQGAPGAAPRPFGLLNGGPAGGAAPPAGAGAGAGVAGNTPGDSGVAAPAAGGTGQAGAGSGSGASPAGGAPGSSRLPGNVQGGAGTTNGGAGQAGTGSGRAGTGGAGPQTAGSGAFEPVYVPGTPVPDAPTGAQERIAGAEAPGQGGGQDTTVVRSGPGAKVGVKTPYNRVIGQYRDAAAQALDRSTIPSDAKQYVRDYFNSLDTGP